MEITYKGKKITVEDEAVLSNRVFTGWWGDAEEGDEYTAEYHANGTDEDGNSVMVYWQFGEIKGEEVEDASDYPWDAEHVSKVVYQ